ncbi:hypothetical protein CASFOL_027547 [Castilleja foliolosa]|uniref:Glycosyltransferase n=1 Tax=Castilleja foliolosa TaxID=1961234 RepID=A0ABD3CGP0_9LAMI
MAEKHSKPHAILIPLPYQGIINPFIYLSLKLASKGFKVTFVHLEFIHHKLSKAHHDSSSNVDFFSEARKSGLDIHCATISDGYPLEFDRDLNFSEYWNFLYREFPTLVDEFIEKTIISNPNSAHFLVAEPLCVWPAAVADKYKLVNVAFSTEAAFVFCLAYHWDLLKEKGHLPCKDNKDVEIDYIPGLNSISTKDLVTYFDPQCAVAESLFIAFTNAKKADFVLHNTVQELEFETLLSLNKYQPNYAIGPVNFFKNPANVAVSKSFWPESDCANWLSSKPAGSVLYVSFGSLVQTSKHVMEEIAYGLLLSGVNFVWVVREGIVGSSDSNVLPIGFENEIKDNQGLIVTWCDQIMVLSDPSVGGFLTHSGWNSTLESMWSGVPMICYPLAYDQPTNRKLVVDDWKIGINLCDYGTLIDRNEIGEKIKSFMNGAIAERLRQEAKMVKGSLMNALEVDGSSEKNFDRFVDDLMKKLVEFESYN